VKDINDEAQKGEGQQSPILPISSAIATVSGARVDAGAVLSLVAGSIHVRAVVVEKVLRTEAFESERS